MGVLSRTPLLISALVLACEGDVPQCGAASDCPGEQVCVMTQCVSAAEDASPRDGPGTDAQAFPSRYTLRGTLTWSAGVGRGLAGRGSTTTPETLRAASGRWVLRGRLEGEP